VKDVIKISLLGGLNNKIIRLQNILPVAIENNLRIIEPKFGWKLPTEKEKFSNLFDLNFFNENIEKKYGIPNILIPRNEYLGNEKEYNIVKYVRRRHGGGDPFWKKSSLKLKTNMMSSLRPHKKLENIIQENSCKELLAVQLRIESDWKKWKRVHGKNARNESEDENVLISQIDFIEMFKNSEIYSENIFFTTGEDQNSVREKFKSFDINSRFFYDKSLGYETNAVINFYLCVGAKNYIGMTRSTFSQNVFFCRYLNGECNSYFYNYGEKLHKKNCNVHSLSFDDMNAERFLEK